MTPFKQAQRLAEQLKADPVVAGQIKEHIKPEELLELLSIKQEEQEDEALVIELERRGFTVTVKE